MKRSTQSEIFGQSVRRNLRASFGGSNLKSNPKVRRPISTKDLMHVVLKSERAQGIYSLLRHERYVLSLVHHLARKLCIQVKEVVVMGNHIHLLIRVRSRANFKAFLRSLTGLIARRVLGAERGRAATAKRFFSGRPFSRIVAQGLKSFKTIVRYFALNRLEKMGFSKSKSRSLGLRIESLSSIAMSP